MHLFEKTIDSEVKYEGKILTVCSDKAELENGAIVSRDVIRHSGGVGVVPVTDEGDVLFVRQFRYPFQRYLWKFPQESSTQAKITQKPAGESFRRKQAAPASSSDIWDI